MNPPNPIEALTMFEYIYRGWPIFLGVMGLMAWLIRLEAKVVYHERRINDIALDSKNREEAMQESLKEMQNDIRHILQHLAKIEGKLEGSSTKNQ